LAVCRAAKARPGNSRANLLVHESLPLFAVHFHPAVHADIDFHEPLDGFDDVVEYPTGFSKGFAQVQGEIPLPNSARIRLA
jgi:hypothetical protein